MGHPVSGCRSEGLDELLYDVRDEPSRLMALREIGAFVACRHAGDSRSGHDRQPRILARQYRHLCHFELWEDSSDHRYRIRGRLIADDDTGQNEAWPSMMTRKRSRLSAHPDRASVPQPALDPVANHRGLLSTIDRHLKRDVGHASKVPPGFSRWGELLILLVAQTTSPNALPLRATPRAPEGGPMPTLRHVDTEQQFDGCLAHVVAERRDAAILDEPLRPGAIRTVRCAAKEAVAATRKWICAATTDISYCCSRTGTSPRRGTYGRL